MHTKCRFAHTGSEPAHRRLRSPRSRNLFLRLRFYTKPKRQRGGTRPTLQPKDRIFPPGEPPGGEACEPQRQRLAPRAGEGSRLRFSYQNRFIFVSNKKPRTGRQDAGWERGADGKEKAVAPFEVILPFMV